jgi:hypothetical protein
MKIHINKKREILNLMSTKMATIVNASKQPIYVAFCYTQEIAAPGIRLLPGGKHQFNLNSPAGLRELYITISGELRVHSTMKPLPGSTITIHDNGYDIKGNLQDLVTNADEKRSLPGNERVIGPYRFHAPFGFGIRPYNFSPNWWYPNYSGYYNNCYGGYCNVPAYTTSYPVTWQFSQAPGYSPLNYTFYNTLPPIGSDIVYDKITGQTYYNYGYRDIINNVDSNTSQSNIWLILLIILLILLLIVFVKITATKQNKLLI